MWGLAGDLWRLLFIGWDFSSLTRQATLVDATIWEWGSKESFFYSVTERQKKTAIVELDSPCASDRVDSFNDAVDCDLDTSVSELVDSVGEGLSDSNEAHVSEAEVTVDLHDR